MSTDSRAVCAPKCVQVLPTSQHIVLVVLLTWRSLCLHTHALLCTEAFIIECITHYSKTHLHKHCHFVRLWCGIENQPSACTTHSHSLVTASRVESGFIRESYNMPLVCRHCRWCIVQRKLRSRCSRQIWPNNVSGTQSDRAWSEPMRPCEPSIIVVVVAILEILLVNAPVLSRHSLALPPPPRAFLALQWTVMWWHPNLWVTALALMSYLIVHSWCTVINLGR